VRINPDTNFKKDGEKLSYEDSFYFENRKLASAIRASANMPRVSMSIMYNEAAGAAAILPQNKSKLLFFRISSTI
jgi:hypothetical protein